MMTKLVSRLILTAIAGLALLGLTGVALATPDTIVAGEACKKAIELQQHLAGCTDKNGAPLASNTPGLNDQGGYLTELIDVFIYAAGFLAFVFLIIGAVRYVASTGDAKRIQSAKDTIMYSLIGLIVVILARLVVGFIIESAS